MIYWNVQLIGKCYFIYYKIVVIFILWSKPYVTDSTAEHSDDPVLLKLLDKQVNPKLH